ncbi:MAG: hypothetical protein KIT79_01440 [Deltaproteobacteria bacterium]|nr:hypothetical protein [Deltaproteobacteria bacterium]
MTASDGGNPFKNLWEKLPEGSAFRAIIERAASFVTELTEGADPSYEEPDTPPTAPASKDDRGGPSSGHESRRFGA